MRVLIATEDRTGGGLEQVIRKAVQCRLSEAGLPPAKFEEPLHYPGNARLLRACSFYGSYRFRRRPPVDHMVFVLDARNLWNLIGCDPPGGQSGAYLDYLEQRATEAMTAKARAQYDDESWEAVRSGFHPHVLVWERESLILPVADGLGLDGNAEANPYAVRQAAEWVGDRHWKKRNESYQKGADGRAYLDRIARSPDLLATVLESNPSLAAVVDDLFHALGGQ